MSSKTTPAPPSSPATTFATGASAEHTGASATEALLPFVSATEALTAFRTGAFSPTELLNATIEQIERANGDRETGINAFTEFLFDAAKAQARSAENQYQQARKTGSPTPALMGIPVATKEKHGIAGHPLEQGLEAFRGQRSTTHHPVVERILTAGGVIHARTTSPEFSCATVTHSPMWGITRNPWNLRASPGGSSGGAGAALAAGMATLATASDIAGSTRIPAGFTGTVGYKAPYGRIPGLPPLAGDWYRGDGPMARTVADTALLASVMSGRHPLDHTSWGPQGVSPGSPTDPSAVSGLRIGLALTLGNYPIALSIHNNTLTVAHALENAGAEIVPVSLPWTTQRISRTIFAHFGQLLGPAMQELTQGSEEELAAYTRQFIADATEAARDVALHESLAMDARLQQELATAMQGIDVLLTPTQAVEMLEADGDYLAGITVSSSDGSLQRLNHYWEAHMTSPFNVANRCPVLSVPSGMSSVGVPTGIQIVGHPEDEHTVFTVGAAIEALTQMPDYPARSADATATGTGNGNGTH